MKKLLLVALTLTACNQAPNHPADATQSEINMATHMGITVEELRSQTPEEHMRMMMELQQK